MSISSAIRIPFIFALVLGLTSLAHAGKKVVYEGDESVRQICTAIANDKVKKLKRSLKSQKSSPLDNKAHLRFSCNGDNLFSFAKSMNAHKTAFYLAKKFGDSDYIAKHSAKMKDEECDQENQVTEQG